MSAALMTNVDQRQLRTTKFPAEFNVKVDMSKVNIALIKAWVAEEIARILNNEDDVVVELVSNILDAKNPPIKELQIALTGFLDKDAAPFCEKLWKLCLSAQTSPHGIPQDILDAKKAEITQAKAEEEKSRSEALARQEAERERDREIARVRDRERSERERDRGGARGSGRDFDRRPLPRDYSRSPPPRRRRDDDAFRRPRRTDTYVPGNNSRNDGQPRRRRSPSYSREMSRSRSRSPPPTRRRRDRDASSSPSPPPPRRRRNSSSDSGRSRTRGSGRKKNGRLSYRRSPSPRRHRRRSGSSSRSPPPKRARRTSTSPNRPQTSESHESQSKKPDLMASKAPRKDEGRLNRNSEAEEEEKTNSLFGSAAVASQRQLQPPTSAILPAQQHRRSSLAQEQALKAELKARMDVRRRDSGVGSLR